MHHIRSRAMLRVSVDEVDHSVGAETSPKPNSSTYQFGQWLSEASAAPLENERSLFIVR